MRNTMPAEAPEMTPAPHTSVIHIREENAVLPDPDRASYYALEKERKLYLEGDVDDGALSLQKMILRWNIEDAGKPATDRQPIWLYIFSPGGEVGVMWALIDTIEASETPVYTVNIGLAASAAGLIFLAGHKRYMTRRSRVVIHEGAASMSGDAVKVMDAGEMYRKMLRQMKDYVLERTRISPAALNKQKCHDWELDAPYCLAHGVCDAVAEHLGEIM